jgi:hypothetical protein
MLTLAAGKKDRADVTTAAADDGRDVVSDETEFTPVLDITLFAEDEVVVGPDNAGDTEAGRDPIRDDEIFDVDNGGSVLTAGAAEDKWNDVVVAVACDAVTALPRAYWRSVAAPAPGVVP